MLDKRAGIYSSRPRMLVFGELGAGQANLINMYTHTAEQRERWRVLRKLMHHAVGVQQVRKYRSFQNDESKVVALSLLASPADYVAHFERYATSVVSIVGFGQRVARVDDPIITEVIAVGRRAAGRGGPGGARPGRGEAGPGRARGP